MNLAWIHDEPKPLPRFHRTREKRIDDALSLSSSGTTSNSFHHLNMMSRPQHLTGNYGLHGKVNCISLLTGIDDSAKSLQGIGSNGSLVSTHGVSFACLVATTHVEVS